MALTSPRFQPNAALADVEANRKVLKIGSSGTPVHLVQMALLDLGYSLPVSTTNANYSPDGIYGEETRQAVQKFQTDCGTLKDDGVVGQKTIRELDRRFGALRHQVRLHFRSIAQTHVAFQRSLSNAELVYAMYGIEIEFASGESIHLTPAQRALFDRVDQACNWDLDDGEINELQGLGSRAPANEILVFYVNTFADNNLLGCGGHARNRPACTIAAHAGAWDTAHEVCHVLLTSSFNPVHISDQRNLMHPESRSSPTPPVLTDRQVKQIRNSPLCRAI
ncbi:MAG: peptidoglycan-binding protein [Pirellulales bacterium]|nr:peptidoglycan-binding protein [Thermoguttaceae bacterium]MDD4785817.1 peptidoglycan-binding protein [Pirellulales bacterium]NLY99332.1 peptidoglycan-binding protein [Pirellulaceae bacterium]